MSKNFNVRGKITVTVHSARELAVKQLVGEMDPYVKFTVKGEKFKTPVAENGHRNPKWEYSFIGNLDGDEDALHLKVYNKGNVTDDLMSRADIELPNLDLSGKPAWYSLRDPDNFSKVCGEIQLSLAFDGNGLPVGSKALQTHEARTKPQQTGAVAPIGSPMSPQQFQSQPPAYQSQQAPVYGQPPMQPMMQQQPMYQQQPPMMQQQPMYQQQPMMQQAPVYQQPMMQQPMMQQPMMGQPTYQPAPVMQVQYQQPAPQPGLFGSITQGVTNLAQQAVNTAQQIMATAPQYRGKWDDNGYLQIHPDVKAAGVTGWNHYTQWGYKENRPIALTNGLRGRFDTAGYHALHPDVKNAGMDSFQHFTQWGKNENRDLAVIPTGAAGQFDDMGYFQSHPDVQRAGMNAWDHYRQYGHNERRRITVRAPDGTKWTGNWDSNGYHAVHPDVKKAGIEGFSHYMQWGKNENRTIVITL